jgi:hypothetical protein
MMMMMMIDDDDVKESEVSILWYQHVRMYGHIPTLIW